MELASKKIIQLTSGDHDIQSYAKDGNDLIISKMRHDLPTEVFRIRPNGIEEQLTFTNRQILKNVKLVNRKNAGLLPPTVRKCLYGLSFRLILIRQKNTLPYSTAKAALKAL
jgi:hypothetical protein